MSFHEYLACSHPLPEGDFGKPPLRVYESNSDFMDSPDYLPIPQRDALRIARTLKQALRPHMGDALAEEERRQRLRQLSGRILVYETPEDSVVIGVQNIPAECLSPETARQLSLPYVYAPYGDTLAFLCMFLLPEGRAELLRQWEGHGENLLRAARNLHIDLEFYARTRQWPRDQVYDNWHNTFMTIAPLHAPRLSDPGLRPLRRQETECVGRVFINRRCYSVHLNLGQLQDQGLF